MFEFKQSPDFNFRPYKAWRLYWSVWDFERSCKKPIFKYIYNIRELFKVLRPIIYFPLRVISFKKILQKAIFILFKFIYFFKFSWTWTLTFFKYNTFEQKNLKRVIVDVSQNSYICKLNLTEPLRKYQKFVKTFLNKFMSAGKKYIIERVFFNILWTNKSSIIFPYLYEAIIVLKPFVSMKIFKYKPRGKKKSVKKGKKKKKDVKIIPENVSDMKSYRMAFRWLVNAILKENKILEVAIVDELKALYHKKGKALKLRKSFYKLAAKHRSSIHFRWRK